MLAAMKAFKHEKANASNAKPLGYKPLHLWRKVLIPSAFIQLSFCLFLLWWAFSFTVVDLALVIGPKYAVHLAVTLFRLVNDPIWPCRYTAQRGRNILDDHLICFLVLGGWELAHKVLRPLGTRL